MAIQRQDSNQFGQLLGLLSNLTMASEQGRQRSVATTNQVPFALGSSLADSLERARQRRFQASQSSKQRKHERTMLGLQTGTQALTGGITGGVAGGMEVGIGALPGAALGAGIAVSGVNPGAFKDYSAFPQAAAAAPSAKAAPTGWSFDPSAVEYTTTDPGGTYKSAGAAKAANDSVLVTPKDIGSATERLKKIGAAKWQSGDREGAFEIARAIAEGRVG
jgi:hypothetical protein